MYEVTAHICLPGAVRVRSSTQSGVLFLEVVVV